MTDDRAKWRNTVKSAADELLANDSVISAGNAAKKVASKTGQTLGAGIVKARKQITQEDSFAELELTLSDVVEVVRIQHAKIQALTERLDRLEGGS